MRALSNASISRRAQKGMSLVETSLVVGILGILSTVGLGMMRSPRIELTCVQQDIPAAVMQAMHLARDVGYCTWLRFAQRQATVVEL